MCCTAICPLCAKSGHGVGTMMAAPQFCSSLSIPLVQKSRQATSIRLAYKGRSTYSDGAPSTMLSIKQKFSFTSPRTLRVSGSPGRL